MPMKADLGREMRAFREALRSRGLSATYQRLAIAEAAFSTHVHFSANELLARVREQEPHVGRVTVYRTLEVLVEAGLVEIRQFRPDRLLYEHVVGHRHHDHMVCVRCGKILEFESPAIEREQQAAASGHGFLIVHHSHTLFGHCKACRKRLNGRSNGKVRSSRG